MTTFFTTVELKKAIEIINSNKNIPISIEDDDMMTEWLKDETKDYNTIDTTILPFGRNKIWMHSGLIEEETPFYSKN